MAAVAFESANLGALVVIGPIVIMQLLKVNYALEPNSLQGCLLVIALPRDLAMLWGIASDTVKLPLYKDAPKKSLWVTFAAIECVLLLIAGVVQMPCVGLFVLLMALGSLCLQFFNTVA